MERRIFLKKLSVLGACVLSTACFPPKNEKFYATEVKFGNNQDPIRYYSTTYGLQNEMDKNLNYGYIGLGKVLLYKDFGEGEIKGPIQKAFFAYNSFLADVCEVNFLTQTYQNIKIHPLDETYLILDNRIKAPQIFSSKLTIFKLETFKRTNHQIYLGGDMQFIYSKDQVTASGVWKIGEDGVSMAYVEKFREVVSSMKGSTVAYIYEEYPIKIERG